MWCFTLVFVIVFVFLLLLWIKEQKIQWMWLPCINQVKLYFQTFVSYTKYILVCSTFYFVFPAFFVTVSIIGSKKKQVVEKHNFYYGLSILRDLVWKCWMNAFIFTDRQNFNQKNPPLKSIMPNNNKTSSWWIYHFCFIYFSTLCSIFLPTLPKVGLSRLFRGMEAFTLLCMVKFRREILCRKLFQIQNFKPVIAILADHLLVPSSTLCLIAFIWPAWLFSSTPNTALIACEIEKKHNQNIN